MPWLPHRVSMSPWERDPRQAPKCRFLMPYVTRSSQQTHERHPLGMLVTLHLYRTVDTTLLITMKLTVHQMILKWSIECHLCTCWGHAHQILLYTIKLCFVMKTIIEFYNWAYNWKVTAVIFSILFVCHWVIFFFWQSKSILWVPVHALVFISQVGAHTERFSSTEPLILMCE